MRTNATTTAARWATWAVVYAGTLAGAAEPTTFVHPGGGYSVRVPAGWKTLATVDDRGLPYHVHTPDAVAKAEQATRGVWLFAIPVPTNVDLSTDRLAPLISDVLVWRERGLKVAADARTPAKLGPLDAVQMTVTGTRADGQPWSGRMTVAVQEDNFLVANYGGAPDESATFLPECERVLATVAPVKAAVRDAPPVPAQVESAADVAAQLTPATPMIVVKDREGDLFSTGSGFIVSPDGYVVTNRHVVAGSLRPDGTVIRETYDPIGVQFDRSVKEDLVPAEVVAVSWQYDLALLKIARKPSAGGDWPFARLIEFDKAARGQRVVVMGWPAPSQLRGGYGDINLNEGSISALNHDHLGRLVDIRHSARTTAGNSGGPLHDLNVGGIVGVHYCGFIVEAHGLAENLFHGAVPGSRVVWEFPQVLAVDARPARDRDERRALMGYYLLQERFGAAALEARSAIEADPTDGVAHAYLYRIYKLQGSNDRAAESLKVALAQADSRKLATVFAGRSAAETDDLRAARRFGEEAIGLAPDDPEGYIILAYALAGMGRTDEARKAFADAAARSPTRSPEIEASLGGLALTQHILGQQISELPTRARLPAAVEAEARQHIDASLGAWPTRNWVAYHNRALLAALSGDQKAFDASFEASQDVDPHSPDAKLAAAYIDLLFKQPGAALNKINEAEEVRPSSRCYFLRGWANVLRSQRAAEQGKPQLVQEYLRLAVQSYLLSAKTSPDAHWSPVALAVARQLAPLVPKGK